MEHELAKAALIILICPLVGFLIQIFFSKKLPRQGDWLTTLFILAPLSIAIWMVVKLLGSPNGIEPDKWVPLLGENWIAVGGEAKSSLLRLDFGIQVDNLTVVMLFVVTLVAFLVHLYSWGYMHGEVRYNRFFAFLQLFSFSMLGLCITSNLLFLFMFWELVGVCSYYLIGFYFEKRSAQQASIKAFMTTRLGDIGFLIAILIIASVAGTLEFDGIFASVAEGKWSADPVLWGLPLIAVAGICLLLGPIGKSAQFPFHVWLPDAMEGPTPVSALIHAATMVAAGVYLVGRMFPFLAGSAYFQGDFYSSEPLLLVAVIGGFTAFFAATIAFAQNDIKKVLAYSTISQLGYMFIGLGVGSVSAGLFHLTTHAFFKALLFLGSGSVIHAVHSNVMEDMGGLRKKLPITWVTFLIGTLAIAGLPFLSGFYSKEAILGNALAFAHHRADSAGVWAYLPFVFGILTAGMTAFYMFRLYFKTFHGAPRNQHAYDHAHESPWTMAVPLCVLAVLAVCAGGFPGPTSHWFADRVEAEVLVPVAVGVGTVVHEVREYEHETAAGIVMAASIAMFVVGVGLSALFFAPFGPFYRRETLRPGTLLWPVYVFLQNLWYVDRFLTWLALRVVHHSTAVCGYFDRVFVDGFVNWWGGLTRFLTAAAGALDHGGVDGAVRALGDVTLRAGRRLRRVQSGFLQEYLYASLYIGGGVVVLLVLLKLWFRDDWKFYGLF